MPSKTLGLIAAALLISATLAFAGDVPVPAAETLASQPAPAEPQPTTAETAQPVVQNLALIPELATQQTGEAAATGVSKGESCGGATCGTFEYCCNPSCSICVLYGMSCTQQSCN